MTDDELDDAATMSWVVEQALDGAPEMAVLAGVCDRLNATGMAITRAVIAGDLLDPQLGARGVRWQRDEGAVEQTFERRGPDEPESDDWVASPFYALVSSGERMMRRQLETGYRSGEFSLLDRFKQQGATDYLAFVVNAGERMRLGDFEGIAASWLTDRPGGFTDAEVGRLSRLMPVLALAFIASTTNAIARTLIRTYLGSDAAERVLAGNIVRGQAETITAVVWYSDLVGFTRIAEQVGRDGVLALLNDYAEAQVLAIEAQGGHVLKFMGDGILAIFPDPDLAAACLRALDAAGEMRGRIEALNERRLARAQPVTDTHLALHVGDLLYGNFGGPRRLDFTVLGPAVNEAARIEALCGSLEQRVIVSWAFALAAGPAAKDRLVSLGRYAMKGVARPQELFTLDPGEA
jgi:adenylate cyclase